MVLFIARAKILLFKLFRFLVIIVSLSFNTFLVLSVLKLDEGLPNFSSVVEMTSFLYLKNVNLITACLLHENRINDFVQ